MWKPALAVAGIIQEAEEGERYQSAREHGMPAVDVHTFDAKQQGPNSTRHRHLVSVTVPQRARRIATWIKRSLQCSLVWLALWELGSGVWQLPTALV
jgi:hypothetical protein